MKKYLFIVLVLVMASIAFMGCQDSGVTPVPEEPPVIPPTFEETITEKFWSVNRVERYQDTGPRSASADPYALDVCSYWDEDGNIWFYEDANSDGIISPSEPVYGPIPWMVEDDVLYVDGVAWDIDYFDDDGWAIEADVTGTDIGDILGNEYGPYEGWIRLHYVPCMKAFDDGVITAGFAFVFDDMGDALLTDCSTFIYGILDCDDGCVGGKRKPRLVKIDIALVEDDEWDGFAFSFGENLVIIGNSDEFSAIGTLWETEDGADGAVETGDAFIADLVYDMVITVDSAGVATFDFVSRIGGHSFSVETVLDHAQLGEMVMLAVNDADAPVVNP